MATSALSNTVTDPSGTAVAGVRDVAQLRPVPGFLADSTEVAGQEQTVSNASGAWSLTLTRNSDITPANTYYEVTEYIPYGNRTVKTIWTVSVGSTNQTVQDAQIVVILPQPELTAAAGHAHSGTYVSVAERSLQRPGNRWVALGDSITQGAVDNSFNSNGPAWPVYASLMSQQRLHLVRDAGVAGNTSAQMLAHFTTDVTPYAPNIVTILAGTNDIGGSVPLATFKTNIAALVAACRAIGAVPVLGTIPPRSAGAYGPTIAQWNTWLRYYAETQGLAVLDFYRTLTNPADGHYIAAYDNDGVHPSAAGHYAMGEVAAAALDSLVPSNGPFLAVDNTDTSNLLTGGLFLTDTAGIGTGWTQNSPSTGITKSCDTVAGVAGKMQTIVGAAVPNFFDVRQTVSTGFSVGDTLRACGIVSSDGGSVAEIKVSFTGPGTFAKPITAISGVLNRAVFCQDFVVPATTTAIVFILLSGPAEEWSGTLQYGQIGLYNLTTLGTLT